MSMPIRAFFTISSAISVVVWVFIKEYPIGVILIIFLFWLVVSALTIFNSQYLFTSKRVFSRYGLISRKMADANRSNVIDTRIEQGFFDQLLNTGNLYFNTGDSSSFDLVFNGIADPGHFRIKLEEILFARIREKERVERERLEAKVDEHFRKLREKEEIEYKISAAEDMYLTTDVMTEEEYNQEIEYLRARLNEIRESIQKDASSYS